MTNRSPSRRSRRPSFLGTTAIVSTGYTEFSRASGSTVLELAVDACMGAVDAVGLEPQQVDGIVSYSLFNDSVACQAVGTTLAIPELRYALDLNMGGTAPSLCVMQAAMAVDAGLAEHVLVFRALNGRSGVRIGQTAFDAPTLQYRHPVGLTAYPQYMALLARRYMLETGSTEEDLGAVVVAQSEHAQRNHRAIRRRKVELPEYFDAPYVVEPFRTLDCTAEVDGACAVLVTSLERARELTAAPVVIEGAAWITAAGSGLDIADLSTWPDYATICQHHLAERLWQSSGLGPADMDFAEIYDCFSAMALLGIEGLGLAARGEAGALVRSGETGLNGQLPVNTHGGLLFEGYVHGMNTLCEAVVQLQHRAGERQVVNAAKGVVSSGAMGDGSALVLVRDGA